MSLLATAERAPLFRTGQFVGADMQLNVLRDNALTFDAVSRLGRPAHQYRWQNDPVETGVNPVVIFSGAFRYTAGMDTLTILTDTIAAAGTDVLDVLINGSGTATSLSAGTQTITRALSGFTNGEIVEVELRKRNTGAGGSYNHAVTIIRDAYVGPVTLADAWPGVPSFGAITAANLNQLSSASDWLLRRMGMVTQPLFMTINRENGPFQGQTTVRWNGSVRRTTNHTGLRVSGTVLVLFPGATEQVRLLANNSVVATYTVPSTVGEYTWALSHTLTGSVDAVTDLQVDMVRTAGGQLGINRFSLIDVSVRDAGDGSQPSLAELTPGVLGNFSAAQSWLNSLASIFSGAYTRLTNNPDIWSRQRLFRQRYARPADNAFERGFFAPSRLPLRLERVGDALAVRGKGLTAGWGPGAFKEPVIEESGLYDSENFSSTTLIDNDQVVSATRYFSGFEGLFPGAAYNVRGIDVRYAGEVLRIVETL